MVGSWMESWMHPGVGPAGSAWVLGRGTVQDARQWPCHAMSMFAADIC